MDKKTADRFAKALSTIEVADNVPEGWVTTREIAEAQGLSTSQVHKKLHVLLAKGKVETKRFRIKTSRGFYPVPHYRIK